MSAQHNEPAFPVTPTDRSGQIAETYLGMSIRDWFAGKALQGALANPSLSDVKAAAWMAAYSFEVADAMLAAREAKL